MSPLYIFEELRLPMELLAAVLIFLIPFAEKKNPFLPRAVSGFIFISLFSLLYFVIFLDKENPRFYFLTAPWYVLFALSGTLYGKWCFKVSWQDALFFNISAFLTQNIVYCFYHCFLAQTAFPSLRQHLLLYISGTFLCSAAVFIPVYFIFRKPLKECRGKLLDDSRYQVFGLVTMYMAMMVTLLFYQGAFHFRVSFYDRLAWLSGIVLCIFFLIILYSLIRAMVRSRETMVLENMLRSSEHYYELTKQQIAIINRKCHDLKHQLKALESASEEDRKDYIREVRHSVDFYQHLVYSDNEALNTILAEKGLLCQEKQIEFRCSADDADLSFIRLPDLYALLGNAIDNAIEYAESQQDPAMRVISLRIQQSASFIGIQITNPYHGDAIPSDQLPATHKNDPLNHGFGMQSIRYLAEKYGGSMEFSTADGLFTLQVMIPCQKTA